MIDTVPSLHLDSLPHTWTTDPREPMFTWEFRNEQYGLYSISIAFWVELLMCATVASLVAAMVGILVYSTIVCQPNTTTAYLWGWGVVTPLWILLPPQVLSSFHISHKTIRFCLGVITPTTSLFRTTEAMYGFTPDHAKKSLMSFAIYYGLPMLLLVNDEGLHVKATIRQTLGHLRAFLVYLIATGLYQSFFGWISFFPAFDQERPLGFYSWTSATNLLIWKDTLMVAMLFQMYLTTFGEGLRFLSNLVTGYQTQPLMLNPLMTANSPTDFWGRKWNLLVHQCLKNGVYKPVRFRMGGSAIVAVIASFTASALFHEWILPMVFIEQKNAYPLGTTSIFFLWQAALIAIEWGTSLGRVFWKDYMQRLPPLLRSIIVVATGVPAGHWMVDLYLHSDFFLHGHIGLIAVRRISDPSSAD